MPLMSKDYNFEHNIPNAWFGSVPGHPFWVKLLADIMQYNGEGIEWVTGPVKLYHSLNDYEANSGDEAGKEIRYTSPGLIFPFDWHNPGEMIDICSAQIDTFNDTECKKHFGNAYTLTYWSHSWGDDHSLENLYNDN
jgi:inositol phosphorylceramide mannosyltransferase catalytic subunit